jgi:hypothetical protein
MDQDEPQPAAEGPRPPVVLEQGQLPDEHGQHVLDEVVRVGGLQVGAAEPALQQRRVDIDQALPRGGLRLPAQPIQQADRGFGHRRFPRVLGAT